MLNVIIALGLANATLLGILCCLQKGNDGEEVIRACNCEAGVPSGGKDLLVVKVGGGGERRWTTLGASSVGGNRILKKTKHSNILLSNGV